MSYVGSSVNLYIRLKDYYNLAFLKITLAKGKNSLIYKALLDEGYGAFNLEILEYCDKQILFEREQYYINLLPPKYRYNIQTKAGSVKPISYITTVVNKHDGSTKVYNSMVAAAKDIRVKYSTLVRYANRDKLLMGIYLITTYRISNKSGNSLMVKPSISNRFLQVQVPFTAVHNYYLEQ